MTEPSLSHVELLTPGCLGTCWHGKYFYLEPWVGCEHDCDYCYARYRGVVQNSLAGDDPSFSRVQPIVPVEELKKQLAKSLSAGNIHILKLCRFTDFFSPGAVRQGWSSDLLEVLIGSPVERIIITTKGVPDGRSLQLMADHPKRFSFNVVAKPRGWICLEPKAPTLAARLSAAGHLSRAGVLTTIHLDPLIPGVEDSEPATREFLAELKAAGLNRVMFSYLLLNDEMIRDLKSRHSESDVRRLLEGFALDADRRYLPKQDETVYYSPKPEVKSASVQRLTALFREYGLEFVLCSLKSGSGDLKVSPGECPRCDGTFYA